MRNLFKSSILIAGILASALTASAVRAEQMNGGLMRDSTIADTPTTVSKPAAPACTWSAVKVSVTNYGHSASDAEKKKWWKQFEESVLDYAKEFVKKNATKLGKTVLKAVIEDTTISRTMDVLVTYACVGAGGDVVATKTVLLEDQYAVHWWTGGKLNEGNEHDKTVAIAKNQPRSPPPAKP
jgi:hypothetical protein